MYNGPSLFAGNSKTRDPHIDQRIRDTQFFTCAQARPKNPGASDRMHLDLPTLGNRNFQKQQHAQKAKLREDERNARREEFLETNWPTYGLRYGEPRPVHPPNVDELFDNHEAMYGFKVYDGDEGKFVRVGLTPHERIYLLREFLKFCMVALDGFWSTLYNVHVSILTSQHGSAGGEPPLEHRRMWRTEFTDLLTSWTWFASQASVVRDDFEYLARQNQLYQRFSNTFMLATEIQRLHAQGLVWTISSINDGYSKNIPFFEVGEVASNEQKLPNLALLSSFVWKFHGRHTGMKFLWVEAQGECDAAQLQPPVEGRHV